MNALNSPLGSAMLKRALTTATTAAHSAGELMRRNLRAVKRVNEATSHDIKLELDVRCQKLIERKLRGAFPSVPILGEEGVLGDLEDLVRWVVDPIDGTVNFSYGIPHACVSIALQVAEGGPASERGGILQTPGNSGLDGRSRSFRSVVGVVYDPFCHELWTAIRGQKARLNGKVIRASKRKKLDEAIVALGFAKHSFTLERMLPTLNELIHRVRKIRIMGAAALSLVYVATGRMDAYIEYGLRLWDIAAGGLIVECAGGEFWNKPVDGDYTYQILASNGLLRKQLEKAAGTR